MAGVLMQVGLIAKGQKEIEVGPDDEREEIREIYAAKRFIGQLLEAVVSTITSSRETWVSTMMNEELHLQPVAERSLIQSGLVVTASNRRQIEATFGKKVLASPPNIILVRVARGKVRFEPGG